MPHFRAKVWVHLIYSTKHRDLLIPPSIEAQVYDNLAQELHLLGCGVKIINGMPDHVHAPFLLNPKHALSKVVQQIKGSTSHWINDSKLAEESFAWQTGYAAFSVSESKLDSVYNYILKQKEHHEQMGFEDELARLTTLHNIS